MANFLLKKTFLIILLFSILSISISISLIIRDFTWFQRSGSLVTLISALMISRNTLLLSLDEQFRIKSDYSFFKSREPSKLISAKERVKNDIIFEKFGLLILLIGTIIWGYADLLNRFLT